MPAEFDFASMHAAIGDYHNTVDSYEKWKAVRPFLHVGQCAHKTALVLRMIAAVEAIIGFQRSALILRQMDAKEFEARHRYWFDTLETLRRLLEDEPPPLGPSHNAVPSGRRSSY